MPFTIYTHAACGQYFLTPLLALEHLWSAHPASTSAMQTAFGQEGLQTLLSTQTLHLAPPALADTKPLYACLPCSIVFHASFAAQTHLEHAHAAEVARTREMFGNAGIAKLITPVWIADDAAGAITLRVVVRNYTRRAHYPALLSLTVTVPRSTGTVVELARGIEAAFVAEGGPPGRIAWAEMVGLVGLRVGDGVVVDTDAKVVEWVCAAEGEVHAMMDGDAGL